MQAEPLVARSEYLWVEGGPAAIHAHMARPVVMALDRHGAHRVLDLGCGNGWLTAALARCGFEATGLDLSHSGIQIARAAHPEVPFHQGDALLPPPAAWQGRFDAVVAVETVDHVARPEQLLAHALQVLRPGGLLLLSVPYHGYLKNLGIALLGRTDLRLQALLHHGRLKFFSRQTLTALAVQAGFTPLDLQRLGRVPPLARSMLLVARR
ncbi:class I SAM-dependent methyltransferase [Rubrivivax rivuli]|nr:class I SAM-dependent methyltransferase [Rubrivivax rivuli]